MKHYENRFHMTPEQSLFLWKRRSERKRKPCKISSMRMPSRESVGIKRQGMIRRFLDIWRNPKKMNACSLLTSDRPVTIMTVTGRSLLRGGIVW